MAEKTNMWCKNCNKNTPCPVTESRGLMRWSGTDVRYRERRRECDLCQNGFTTLEIEKETFRNYRMAAIAFENVLNEWQDVENLTIDRAKRGLEWLKDQRQYLDLLLNRITSDDMNTFSKPMLKLVEDDAEKLSD